MRRLGGFRAVLLALAFAGVGCGSGNGDVVLVNVSYDPTRELYEEINRAFADHYRSATGQGVRVRQSHGASGAQAGAVIAGQRADVVTLGLSGDVDAIAQRGRLALEWRQRLPNRSCPYTSTVVFLVRRGNPRAIHKWEDLGKPGVQVITPNPKTSGGGRWNFLAAWGSVTIGQGRSAADAEAFLARVLANVPKLDAGARGATETFLKRGQGDVLLAWENEALLVAGRESAQVEVVYPEISILAEPPVAVVDKVVDRRGTRAAAEAYVQFLYTEPAQEIMARHGYRPSDAAVAARHAGDFPSLRLFTVDDVAGGWESARTAFFADGAAFDRAFAARGGS
jgi:sulfate transport system substrate-binding protein